MAAVDPVVNVASVVEEGTVSGPIGHYWKVLTPSMQTRGGSLGVNQTRIPPGHVSCPFHWHLRADEVFFVLSGRGVLRYGDGLRELGPGDCVSCPAGSQTAHQLANPFEEDFVYLAIGCNDPHEVCVYPDNGKTLVRGIKQIGFLDARPYMEGEPEPPRIFELWRQAQAKSG